MQMLFGSLALGLALVAQTPQAPHMDRGVPTPVNASVADDPEIAKVIAPLAADVQASFGKVLASAPKGLDKGPGLGNSPLGYFLADVMRDAATKAVGTEVRFAFTNSGGLRRSISPGMLKVSDVYEVLPFENELVVAEYTGAEIMAIVKEGIVRRGGEPTSGIKASVTGTPEHPVVSITWSDGAAIDPQAMYKLATTDYLLATGDATPSLKLGRHMVPTGVPVRTLVLNLCIQAGKEGKPVVPPEGSRYTYSPEIAEALKAKTFKF
jgi:2',3'-cyclic-nucleotide 2'-phosphodiesterase (5'-nucleotidase family)